MANYQLGVIGAGQMAEALLRGVVAAGVLARTDIVAADPDAKRRQVFTSELGIDCRSDNSVPAACPRVLLAVKPQMLADVLAGIAPHVRPDALVLSIAAGMRTSWIHEKLGDKGRILRIMPNTPMLIGRGASALSLGPAATAKDLAWADRLFAACGTTVHVAEPMLDAVTAVSGSGPAYFFYLVEALVAAGSAEGLAPDVALRLAVETCRGAGELLARTGEKPEILRARVTSPKGTTQAALDAMEAAGVKAALVAAIRKAAERSRELGK